jgi:hypothetical protein
MILIEIPPNPNCDPVDLRVFHDTAPAQRVAQMQHEREPGQPAWYDITGWTTDGCSCPAQVVKVDDSGEGVAWLIFGGDAGLRFRPAGGNEPWNLGSQTQWGESFIITTDIKALRVLETPKKNGA